jgi:hypothetical protein
MSTAASWRSRRPAHIDFTPESTNLSCAAVMFGGIRLAAFGARFSLSADGAGGDQ